MSSTLMITSWIALIGAAAPSQETSAEEYAELFAAAVKQKHDVDAIALLDLVVDDFSGFDEAGRKALVKAVDAAISKRRPEGEDRLHVKSLEALGEMGPLGLKALRKSLKKKPVKDRPLVLSAALLAIGQHRDVKQIATLADYLVYKEPVVVAAAAEALGAPYRMGDEKTRKSIVKELVKSYSNYASLAAANPREPIFAERLRVVEPSMKGSLEVLTGQRHADSPSWQKWYNDHKSKKWPPLKKGDSAGG